MQLEVRNDVARLQKEENKLRKTKLQQELRQQMRENSEKKRISN
jgi:hypothetical protein